jgi:hypothetical protein
VQRYAPKILAFNHILKKLKDVEPDGCKFRSPTDILFHHNDHKQMRSDYNGLETIRKPNIIMASKLAMKKSQGSLDLNLTSPLCCPFDWDSPRSTEENKCIQTKINHPPPMYSVHLSSYIPMADDVGVVFKGSVRSGFCTLIRCHCNRLRPQLFFQATRPNHKGPVDIGSVVVYGPVSTGLEDDRLRPVLPPVWTGLSTIQDVKY